MACLLIRVMGTPELRAYMLEREIPLLLNVPPDPETAVTRPVNPGQEASFTEILLNQVGGTLVRERHSDRRQPYVTMTNQVGQASDHATIYADTVFP
jgi:hypothetical protein